ncbi:hypothetical protein ACBJ59_50875 [Nonomuraea sp. MTCD27]|uniref:hypothetical protein n=1 Tax=Nonomuraea sp. MTCD27 TaxID=1676747 RepID=UPI0035C22D7B
MDAQLAAAKGDVPNLDHSAAAVAAWLHDPVADLPGAGSLVSVAVAPHFRDGGEEGRGDVGSGDGPARPAVIGGNGARVLGHFRGEDFGELVRAAAKLGFGG